MLKWLAVVALALGGLAGCTSGGGDMQSKFGVQMAKINLWREALFRFERAVELNPDDAMAHNNLAVAYEANGDFEKAARQYREAMRLDKSNQYIQKNYSRFVEFNSRNRRREQRTAAATTATASTAGATTEPAAAEPQPAPATPPADSPTPTEPTPPPAEPVLPPQPVPPPPGERGRP